MLQRVNQKQKQFFFLILYYNIGNLKGTGTGIIFMTIIIYMNNEYIQIIIYYFNTGVVSFIVFHSIYCE